mmetsp:Transcript_22633/g.27754  ORF Transcript_22633/g.27754 Transcript_22633/m.27754 type:complete len:550 (+) Transcript_22633:178-1827(+)
MDSTDNNVDRILYSWMPRLGSVLSIFASVVVIRIVLATKRTKKSRWKELKPNRRITLIVSIADLMFCFGYLFTTIAMPSETGSVWAIGNDFTCAAQGFFIQVGVAVPLYMASLCVFYWCCICREMKPTYFTAKIEPFVHLGVLIFGFGTAIICVGLNLFEPINSVCWIRPESTIIRFFFAGVHLLLSWFVIIFCMTSVFLKVRHGTQSNFKYFVTNKRKEKLLREQNETLRQTIMAIGIHFFLYVWPIAQAFFSVGHDHGSPFLLNLFTCLVLPFQGFLNGLIFTRPLVYQAVVSGSNQLWVYGQLIVNPAKIILMAQPKKPKKFSRKSQRITSHRSERPSHGSTMGLSLRDLESENNSILSASESNLSSRRQMQQEVRNATANSRVESSTYNSPLVYDTISENMQSMSSPLSFLHNQEEKNSIEESMARWTRNDNENQTNYERRKNRTARRQSLVSVASMVSLESLEDFTASDMEGEANKEKSQRIEKSKPRSVDGIIEMSRATRMALLEIDAALSDAESDIDIENQPCNSYKGERNNSQEPETDECA